MDIPRTTSQSEHLSSDLFTESIPLEAIDVLARNVESASFLSQSENVSSDVFTESITLNTTDVIVYDAEPAS